MSATSYRIIIVYAVLKKSMPVPLMTNQSMLSPKYSTLRPLFNFFNAHPLYILTFVLPASAVLCSQLVPSTYHGHWNQCHAQWELLIYWNKCGICWALQSKFFCTGLVIIFAEKKLMKDDLLWVDSKWDTNEMDHTSQFTIHSASQLHHKYITHQSLMYHNSSMSRFCEWVVLSVRLSFVSCVSCVTLLWQWAE